MKLEELQNDMKTYMKEKNKLATLVVKDIISTAKNNAIANNRKEVNDGDIKDALIKLKKIYNEQIDVCPTSRGDKLNEYIAMLGILKKYLPKQLTKDEVKTDVIKALEGKKFDSVGQTMKFLMPLFRGRADGKIVKDVVKGVLEERNK